jgi:hypothetical protein
MTLDEQAEWDSSTRDDRQGDDLQVLTSDRGGIVWMLRTAIRLVTGSCEYDNEFTDFKNAFLWDVMPCASCEIQSFERTYRFRHQGDIIQRAGNNVSINYQPKHTEKKY